MDHLRAKKVFPNIASTSYNNADLARISRNLTYVLDLIGFSEEHRLVRVRYNVMTHMLLNICMAITWCGEVCDLSFGSSIEGTTAYGMGSDIDIIRFQTSTKAYSKKANAKQAFCVVFIRDDITPAGHTKLQPVYQGNVINDASNTILYSPWFEFQADSKGRLLVTRFTDIDLIPAGKMHGPALTYAGRANRTDIDIVMAYLCDDITNEMMEWHARDRIHDWPSKDTLDLLKTLGCFIVQVGHPTSPEKNIEWRMSFSLQERHLMWHLNPTQYHCFMLLKLIKTFLIKPQFGDVLTSYHCKTLLFYTIERHEQGIWIPEKLILCLRMCLILLHEWISDKYIPNYFIPKQNMFVKMDAALTGNYDEWKSFVDKMCDNWEFLFDIAFNNLGTYFRETLIGKADHPMVKAMVPYMLVDDMYLKNLYSSDCCDYIIQLQNILAYLDDIAAILQQSSRTSTRYKTFEEYITQLYKQYFAGRTQTPDTLKQLNQLTESSTCPIQDGVKNLRLYAVHVWIAVVRTMLETVLAAVYFRTGIKQYLMESDNHLELILGKSNSVTSMLIKATVLLKRSLFDANNSVLNAAESICKDEKFGCVCYPHLVHHGGKEGEQPFEKVNARRCLYFNRGEFDILPVPLAFEAYKSFGIPTDSISLLDELSVDSLPTHQIRWVDMVAVDPVMYLYYLQFLNNQHNNPGEAAVALHKFENTLFDRLERSDWPGHTDTWLNVLGDIFVKEGWTRLALRCFKQSDDLPWRHNAVRWHVMFLRLKFTESEWANIPIIPDWRP